MKTYQCSAIQKKASKQAPYSVRQTYSTEQSVHQTKYAISISIRRFHSLKIKNFNLLLMLLNYYQMNYAPIGLSHQCNLETMIIFR